MQSRRLHLKNAELTTEYHVSEHYDFVDLSVTGEMLMTQKKSADIAAHAIAHLLLIKKDVDFRDDFDVSIVAVGETFPGEVFVTSPLKKIRFLSDGNLLVTTRRSASGYEWEYVLSLDNNEDYAKVFKEV